MVVVDVLSLFAQLPGLLPFDRLLHAHVLLAMALSFSQKGHVWVDPLGRGLLFLASFIEVDEVSMAPPLLAEDSIEAGVDDVHDGLVELQELGEALGVLLPRGEGEAVGGEGVVPGEGEVAVAALLLHFIYRREDSGKEHPRHH